MAPEKKQVDHILLQAERHCFNCNTGKLKLGTIGCADICDVISETIINLEELANSKFDHFIKQSSK
ncbi:hypothetical protein MTBPR1_80202 [Candidatus Terasakiella magnetica]|uniref:Uncharacterized protein n=1 Tax=Candidatus Terasakiella magnetica TaxID=1867952 RepID=A0A1C3RLM7_9PROT|nr:hypothetical protein [Candidatus Terasakiella magnetica]SCA58148.1 hypothetical protein MTBPR1_80202 [Candidatus Terasakiella magnetica]